LNNGWEKWLEISAIAIGRQDGVETGKGYGMGAGLVPVEVGI
jgi:hypothetical protein